MVKRLVTLALWFYAAWTFGALLSFVTGASELIGPVLGLAAAGLVWFSPRRLTRTVAARIQPTRG
jgi:hypothetical protein